MCIRDRENTAWQAAETEIERIRNLIDELQYESMSESTRAGKKAQYEEDINAQERIQNREAGKESGIDATEALAIENAQKAYDEAIESYNEGVNREAELYKAREELVELKSSAISETFSPTNAFASKTSVIVGSYINDIGSAVALNSPLYNISSTGIEVVFQVDASDQETVSLGDSVQIELPTDERVPTVIKFIDQVVTQTQAGEFIEVTLEVLNPEEIEAYDQAPVKVFVTTEVSQNVLYVPVNALLALAEGGYALEVYDGEIEGDTFVGESGVNTSYVAVEIGVFTDGFVEVYRSLPEKWDIILSPDNPSYKDLPGVWVLIGGLWIAHFAYWGFNQYITQRALGAKSLPEAQKGVMFAAYLKIIMPLVIVLPGICAAVLFPLLETSDKAYPMMMSLLPNGLLGLTFAALIAAIVSSLASMTNSISTITHC